MEVLGFAINAYILAISVFLPIVVFFYRYRTEYNDYWKKRGIPYAPGFPWYHLIYVLLTKPIHELEIEQYRKHGRIYGGFEGRKPNVITIGDPDLLRDILVKDFQFFHIRREFDAKLDPIVGNMIFMLNRENWKRVRTIVTPAFTSGKMRKMTSIINDCSQTLIDTFIRNSKKGVSLDCKRVFGAFTMDVIASSAFATKINSHEDPNNPFVIQAYNAFNKNAVPRMMVFLLMPQILVKLLGLKFIDHTALSFFRNVTLQVIEERRKKGQRGNDFLQLMMDAYKEQLEAENKVDGFKMMDLEEDEKDLYGHEEMNKQIFKTIYQNKNLSQDELLAQCILFFMVGYETTASTLSFVAYSLACNPEAQEKLIQEADQTLKGNSDFTYDIIRDMKYLDCVVSETLRMYPPLLRAERTAVEDYKLNYKGLVIEKGTVIGFPIYAMHHDPEFFAEPEKFLPERFFAENINHPSYAYLPFGAGPRNCLGMRFALMEIKLCIANAVRRVRFKTCPETKIPLEFSMSQGFLSPKGLMLTVEERTDVP